jgi:AcrR family transcriptional regulator
MNENDRRVKRTQRLLGEAFMELILEKGYDNITIRDITERADTAYATFFRHYKSKDEILLQRVDASLRELDQLGEELQGRYFIHVGLLLYEHMEQHYEFYRRVFESPSLSRQLRLRLAENFLFHARARLAQAASPKEPSIPVEIVANHLAAGKLALMEWWLANRRPYSPQRMAEIYDQLIIRASYAALGVEIPPPPNKT